PVEFPPEQRRTEGRFTRPRPVQERRRGQKLVGFQGVHAPPIATPRSLPQLGGSNEERPSRRIRLPLGAHGDLVCPRDQGESILAVLRGGYDRRGLGLGSGDDGFTALLWV